MAEQGDKIWLHRYKLLGFIIPVVVIIVLFLGLHSGKACVVRFDGKDIAAVRSKGVAERALNIVEEQKSKTIGQAVRAGDIALKEKNSRMPVVDRDELVNILEEKVDFVTDGTLVKIDGEPQFYFKNNQLAEQFLDQLKDKYSKGDDSKVSFVEDVSVSRGEVVVKKLQTVEKALQKVEQGKAEADTHEVEKGDTLWELAREYDITVDKLKQLNPDISSILQPGEEVVVSRTQPLLTVIAEYKIEEKQAIPYESRYKMDENLPLGQRKLVQQGQEGEKKVTYRVKAKNGRVVEKSVLQEKTLQQPVHRVVKKGTKIVLSSRGGGGLIWPVSGRITSGYGSRWGGFHSGVDIGAPYGTAVKASAPGKVTRVQYRGGYGKMIEIDHGNGIRTRYAHLSAYGVSRGQVVSRGEYIGQVGTTGNTTGPHVHFEVIISGATKNPVNYL